MEDSLKVVISNIPRERWQGIQNKIFRMLIVEEGLEIETITIKDGITESFLGYEFEITDRD